MVVKKVVVKTRAETLNVCEVAGQCVTVRKTFETAQRKLRPEDTPGKDQLEADSSRRRRSENRPRVGGCKEEDAVRTQGEAWTSRVWLQDAPR